MEPRILITGRLPATLDKLLNTLRLQGRHVSGTTDPAELLRLLAQSPPFDFVVIGGGLNDTARQKLASDISTLAPATPVHLIPRSEGAGPHSMLPFVTRLADEFKIARLHEAHRKAPHDKMTKPPQRVSQQAR